MSVWLNPSEKLFSEGTASEARINSLAEKGLNESTADRNDAQDC